MQSGVLGGQGLQHTLDGLPSELDFFVLAGVLAQGGRDNHSGH